MRIWKILTAVALTPAFALAVESSTPPKAVDAKTRLAVELMDVTHYDQTMQAMRAQIEAMMDKQFDSFATCDKALPVIREFSTEIGEKVSAVIGSEEMKVDVASTYAEVFSEEELTEILAFYRTPLGKKMLDRMPELMRKSMQMSQDRLKTLMPEFQQMGEKYGERINDAAAECKAPAPAATAAKTKKK